MKTMMNAQLAKAYIFVVLTASYILCLYPEKVLGQHKQGNPPEVFKLGNTLLHLEQKDQRLIESYLDEIRSSNNIITENRSTFRAYLDIVDSIFVSQGVPKELKYLAINTISLSSFDNIERYGFWSLKEGVEQELNLQNNATVNEKANLVVVTEEMAKRLKSNNIIYKNWFFTMLSISMTEQEVKKVINSDYNNAKIVGNIFEAKSIHKYTLELIAYTTFFESNFGKSEKKYQVKILNKQDINLNKNTEGYQSKEEFMRHNQWLKKSKIQLRKSYPILVLVPLDQDRTTKVNQIKATTKLEARTEKEKQQIQSILEKQPAPSSRVQEGEVSIELIKKKEKQTAEMNQIIENKPIEMPEPVWKNNHLEAKRIVPKRNYTPLKYTIRSGDNLYRIAERFNVSVIELRVWNDIYLSDYIYPDQTLILKAPYKMKHKVRKAEGLKKIKEFYAKADIYITEQNIMVWNRLSNSLIRTGQTLNIYNPNVRPTFQSAQPSHSPNRLKNKPRLRTKETVIDFKPKKPRIDLNFDKKLMPVKKAKELIKNKK